MENQSGMVLVGFLAGGISLAGAIFDWDWFIRSRRARLFIRLFGRTGTRIIYGIIGLFLIGLGISALMAG